MTGDFMNYKEILDEIGIPLVFSTSPLDGGGYYLPYAFEYGENGAIIVDGTIESDEQMEIITLHECGHKIKGTTLTKLSSSQLHVINEAKANRFMIHCKAIDYLEEIDYHACYYTPERFLTRFKLSVKEFYDMAAQEMEQIAIENQSQLIF